jgi:predicted nucleic acid-binding protein
MRITLDTNILIYAIDSKATSKQLLAQEVLERAAMGDCVLILQSLAEFFNAATRRRFLSAEDAGALVSAWRRTFQIHIADGDALDDAIDATRTHSMSFWDAMLWAGARQAGCGILFSEDLQDGRKLGGVTIVNPFERRNRAMIDSVLPPMPQDKDC